MFKYRYYSYSSSKGISQYIIVEQESQGQIVPSPYGKNYCFDEREILPEFDNTECDTMCCRWQHQKSGGGGSLMAQVERC
jgi:hypothetical protein